MATTINWETDINQALKRAKAKKKPIMLDFFNPQCIDCKQMDAVTYQHNDVIEFTNQFVIPLRVRTDNPLAVDFNIQWTPALIVLDQEGKEQHRTAGFFNAEELIPSLLLAMGVVHSGRKEFNEALGCYEKILNDYPTSKSASEAAFQRWANLYRNNHDPKPLKEAFMNLQKKYQDSYMLL
jgi:hypothetical protein